MKKHILKTYLLTLAILLALSAYPIIMGFKIIFLQFRDGSVGPGDYARYVIPYTAICLSVLIAAALHPLLIRLKRWALPVATVLALGLFTGIELMMEGIAIHSPEIESAVQMQLFSCVYTPDAVIAFQGIYNDTYKLHYFLVSFIMVALVVSVVYGFGKLCSGQLVRRAPQVLQTMAAVLFVGLCVFANLTGFYRLPSPVQPPISGLLTGLFFVVLGASAGIYAGSFVLGRKGLVPIGLPAAVSFAVCITMYWGEYLMLGSLYRFGSGTFYEALPGIVLAPADILVVLLSGVAAAAAMAIARCTSGGANAVIGTSE